VTEKPPPADPARRIFIRQLAGDVMTSMGSMFGAAQLLQAESMEAAKGLLDPDGAAGPGGVPGGPNPIPGEASAVNAGYRAPFRWDEDVIHLVDQRRLPDVLADLQVRGAADAVTAINDGALVGAQVQAQVAAATLALIASRSTSSRAFARRATLRGAANAFRQARPGSAPMALALDRMLALVEQLGVDAEGLELAAALKAEAEAIIEEATDDHGMVVTHGIGVLPGAADQPVHVMAAGSTGAMGGGVFGSALSVVTTAHHQGRAIHALVPEGRPGLEGSRVAAWELQQAGVAHAVVADAAAPACIAADEVQAVLVGADRITADGALIATVGAYPLALAARAAGIPFLVFAPSSAIDLSVAEGDQAPLEEGRPGTVLRFAGQRTTPAGAKARNPVQDLVPADLVAGIVTETGVLRPPYGPALAGAVESASVTRMQARGFALLVAKRAAAGEAGLGGGTAQERVPVDASRPRPPHPEPGPAEPAVAEPAPAEPAVAEPGA
jgi:methylthioribose-1-phosphate isomerase